LFTAPDGTLRQFVQDAAGSHLQTQTRAVNESAGGWFREGQPQTAAAYRPARYGPSNAPPDRKRNDCCPTGCYLNESAGGWFREGQQRGVRYVFDRAGELRQRRDVRHRSVPSGAVWAVKRPTGS
jgi:hypothetical protein